MDIFAAGGALVVGVIAVIAAIILLIFILIMVRAWYKVAKADQALVVVGKSQKGADGASSRISVITGGGALVNPLTQRAEMISLRARQIKMEPTAQASNGVTVNVSGVALVKIGSDPEFVRRAAERFLSQDGAIEQFTTEQLEGALRGVVATLTVEQLMKDRQKLSDQIAEGIKSDLLAQGLILDSFQIQGITDKNGYIDALGATEVERVRREADVARINAAREVRARQIATDEQNLIEQTAFDKNSAAAAAEVEQREGRLDVLINNAGFANYKPFTEIPTDRLRSEIAVNIGALVELTHTFLPKFEERGSGFIINISSIAGFQPSPGMVVYGASKAFVLSFTEGLWSERKDKGVRFLAICWYISGWVPLGSSASLWPRRR